MMSIGSPRAGAGAGASAATTPSSPDIFLLLQNPSISKLLMLIKWFGELELLHLPSNPPVQPEHRHRKAPIQATFRRPLFKPSFMPSVLATPAACRLGTHPLHIPGTLGRTYPQKQAIDVDIVLRGYYGWNSRRAVQVLDQVFPKDAATQPSLVIVYFGGNDSMGSHSSGLGPHVPLPEYIENMRKIALHLKSLSDTTRVIFLSCPPVNEAKLKENTSKYFSELVRTNELCRSYSEACIELCREMGMEVVDLWTAFQRRDDWLTACFTDGVHLAAGGSKVVVEEILKVLKEAEWEPCLHWKSMPTEFSEDSPFDLVAYDGKTTINPSEWTYHREIQWD